MGRLGNESEGAEKPKAGLVTGVKVAASGFMIVPVGWAMHLEVRRVNVARGCIKLRGCRDNNCRACRCLNVGTYTLPSSLCLRALQTDKSRSVSLRVQLAMLVRNVLLMWQGSKNDHLGAVFWEKLTMIKMCFLKLFAWSL